MNLRRATACAVGSLLLAACDIPTEAPILEQTWVLPVENTSVGVGQLLPAGVSVSGGNFAVNVSPLTVSRSLGEVCPSCFAFNGATAPVPAFSATMTTQTSLPANVSSAVIASGSAQIAIQNGFSFDPTQGGGSVTVTLTDQASGRQLGQVALGSGQLPAGQTTSRTLTIAAGGVGSQLTATTVISSPGGQVTQINTNQRITVTATPQALLVSSAQVNVAGRSVQIEETELPDLPDDAGDDVVEGAILLDVTNPFGVQVTAQLQIRTDGGTITKSFTIGSAPTTTVRIALSGEEWRQIFEAENATLTGSGTVSGGTITVTPAQQVGIAAKIELSIRLGD